MAVRVVQRAFESVFAGGLGELRTYNGSRLPKLVVNIYYIIRKFTGSHKGS